ncbi:flavin-containing monooxygenase [Mycobacterium kyorinense]|uniref:Cyclohexanone monooxygenase n=1 Tax=Mycobacterium kyorinense TaxID=487514 RepID=A0A1X1Y068_9MYCO|nr:NAD(P)/FAD-dependent oxidoreductase [Mycobacterium kyorinense]ORW04374.1 cyclohexanone monooxygenase [Mycobacterium kyorinense]
MLTQTVAAELRANLEQADPGVLVAVLAQLSGDPAVVDKFGPAISHVPDPPEQAGVTDPETAAAIVDALLDILTGASEPVRAVAADDPVLFTRIAPIALGVALDDRNVPMLLEQGGFQKPRPVLPRTASVPSTTKIAIVGCGMAGIAAAIAAADAGIAYEIYERNPEVGGTWLTTTYPGIGVDTPSTYYSLSHELNPDWSSYYPMGWEYQSYLQAVADKYKIRDHTRFKTEVEALWWDDENQRWQIRARSADGTPTVSHAHVVITATGYLNRPRLPDLEGRETFAGISIHSAQWDRELDLTGKRVAVIGAGCTAVQIVDAVADDVEHLTVFQRQPHWVAPRRRQSDDVPDYHRWLARHVPYYANWIRLKSYWSTADNNYPVIQVDPEWAASHLSISPANDVLLNYCLDYINRTFGAGSELAKKVTPDFAPYGKRIIRDPGGYYAALTRPHVDVEASEPARVTPNGIVTEDGHEIALDVIIYATGYYLDFLSTIDIRGREGRTLQDEWAGTPRSYRGGTVPGFPNLFVTSHPNGSPGHGGGHNFGVEVAVHYIMECLQLMALRGARSMEPTREAYDEYVARLDDVMENLVWRHTPTAHTYYRVPSGRVVVANPLRMIDWWEEHRAPVEEHFHLR